MSLFRGSNENPNVFIPLHDQVNCQFCGLLFKNQVALDIHYDERHRPLDSFHFQHVRGPEPRGFQNSRDSRDMRESQRIVAPHQQEIYTHVLPPRSQPIENRDEFIASNTIYNHGKSTWDCLMCHKSFREKNDLYQHLRSGTHEARRYPCLECGRAFASLGARAQHAEQSGHAAADPSSRAISPSHAPNGVYLPNMPLPVNQQRTAPYHYQQNMRANQRFDSMLLSSRSRMNPIGEPYYVEPPSVNFNPTCPTAFVSNSYPFEIHTSTRRDSPISLSPDRTGVDFSRFSDPRVSDLSLPVSAELPSEYNYKYTIDEGECRDDQLSALSTGDSVKVLPTYATTIAAPGASGVNKGSGFALLPAPLVDCVLSVSTVPPALSLHPSCAFVLSDAHTGAVLCQQMHPLIAGQLSPGSLVPEYEALCIGLTEALHRGVRRLLVRSDSERMLAHLNTGAPASPSRTPSYSLSSASSLSSQFPTLMGASDEPDRETEMIAQRVRKMCAELQHIRFELMATSEKHPHTSNLAQMLLESGI